MDLTTNHPLHGSLFGIGTAVLGKALGLDNSRALIAGATVGGGAYAYMSIYGHALPWDAETLGESAIDNTQLPPADPTPAPAPAAAISTALTPTPAAAKAAIAEAKANPTAQNVSAALKTTVQAASAAKGIPAMVAKAPTFVAFQKAATALAANTSLSKAAALPPAVVAPAAIKSVLTKALPPSFITAVEAAAAAKLVPPALPISMSSIMKRAAEVAQADQALALTALKKAMSGIRAGL